MAPPSRSSTSSAMAAGISQDGRSRGMRFSGGIDGLRAGVGGGTVVCLGAAGSVMSTGAPVTGPVGVHTGVAIGVQVDAGDSGAAGVAAGVGIAEGGSYCGVAGGGGS